MHATRARCLGHHRRPSHSPRPAGYGLSAEARQSAGLCCDRLCCRCSFWSHPVKDFSCRRAINLESRAVSSDASSSSEDEAGPDESALQLTISDAPTAGAPTTFSEIEPKCAEAKPDEGKSAEAKHPSTLQQSTLLSFFRQPAATTSDGVAPGTSDTSQAPSGLKLVFKVPKESDVQQAGRNEPSDMAVDGPELCSSGEPPTVAVDGGKAAVGTSAEPIVMGDSLGLGADRAKTRESDEE